MRLPSLVLLLAAPVALAGAPPVPGWYDDQALLVGDELRYFRYYVPPGLAASPPLMVYLHGGGSSMREVIDGRPSAAWPVVAERAGFILLLPNGSNAETGDALGDEQHWNDCRREPGAAKSTADDVAFLTALVAWAVDGLGVDAQRVYVGGSSNGGMMTFRIADEAPALAAAIVTFIANRPAETDCRVPLTRPLPAMIVVGTEDPLMPFAGGQVASDRGLVVSADESVAYWVARNGITAAPIVTALPDRDPLDGSTIERQRFVQPRGGPPVVYLRMDGAGHAMPSIIAQLSVLAELLVGRQNHDIEGPEEAWAFLSGFTRDFEVRFTNGFEAP